MTDKARITIATAVTALFLAATSAAGLLAHSHTQPPAPAARPATAVQSVAAPTPTWHEND